MQSVHQKPGDEQPMGLKANPISEPGERNICCPFYAGCLDYAVDNSWDSWNCTNCQFKVIRRRRGEWDYELNETVIYYDLPTNLVRGTTSDLFGKGE
jgi:hypothetical protein